MGSGDRQENWRNVGEKTLADDRIMVPGVFGFFI